MSLGKQKETSALAGVGAISGTQSPLFTALPMTPEGFVVGLRDKVLWSEVYLPLQATESARESRSVFINTLLYNG